MRNISIADGIFYEQIDSATMGSCLAPVIVNIYMESSEPQEINTIPKKPSRWYRYVYDMFVVWLRGGDDLQISLQHVDNEHQNIYFMMELEKYKKFVFDGLVRKESDGLLGHSAYRKPTHAPVPTCRIPRSPSTKEDHFVDASSSFKDHLQYGKSRNGDIILKEEVQVKWLL